MIGTNQNETDVQELMALAHQQERQDSGSAEESNDEGMGDIDLNDESGVVAEEEDDEDEEEKKD